MQSNTKQAILITWAVMATVAAMVFAIIAVWLFVLRSRDYGQTQSREVQMREQLAAPPKAEASPGFANVKETDVPGRYRFVQGGQELGTMTLNADHTFINKDGTTYKQYNWEVSADGLWIQWQRSRSRFSILEKPGVYVEPSANGKELRLEKIE